SAGANLGAKSAITNPAAIVIWIGTIEGSRTASLKTFDCQVPVADRTTRSSTAKSAMIARATSGGVAPPVWAFTSKDIAYPALPPVPPPPPPPPPLNPPPPPPPEDHDELEPIEDEIVESQPIGLAAETEETVESACSPLSPGGAPGHGAGRSSAGTIARTCLRTRSATPSAVANARYCSQITTAAAGASRSEEKCLRCRRKAAHCPIASRSGPSTHRGIALRTTIHSTIASIGMSVTRIAPG